MTNGPEEKQRQSGGVIMNNRFSMTFSPDWEDRSYYRYEGPVEDGIKHNILVTIENNVEVPNLEQYAERNMKSIGVRTSGSSGAQARTDCA